MCSDNHNLPKFQILLAVDEICTTDKIATPESISQHVDMDRPCVSVLLSNYYSQGYLERTRAPSGSSGRFKYSLSDTGSQSLESLKEVFCSCEQ